MSHMRPTLTVEIWSDVVCPWCYIGERRFETAAAQLFDKVDLHVVYRPYQPDPTASPNTSQPVIEAYAKKFGGHQRATEIMNHVTEITAVPTFVFDGRWSVPGAQHAANFVNVIRRLQQRRRKETSNV